LKKQVNNFSIYQLLIGYFSLKLSTCFRSKNLFFFICKQFANKRELKKQIIAFANYAGKVKELLFRVFNMWEADLVLHGAGQYFCGTVS